MEWEPRFARVWKRARDKASRYRENARSSRQNVDQTASDSPAAFRRATVRRIPTSGASRARRGRRRRGRAHGSGAHPFRSDVGGRRSVGGAGARGGAAVVRLERREDRARGRAGGVATEVRRRRAIVRRSHSAAARHSSLPPTLPFAPDAGGAGALHAGSATRNVLPLPGSLSAEMRPPSSSTMSRAM